MFYRTLGLVSAIIFTFALVSCSKPEQKNVKESTVVKTPVAPIKKYQLSLTNEPAVIKANKPVKFTFRITDLDGKPVTQFEEVHEKLMHLIVVSSDLEKFWHIHPVLQPDGSFIQEESFPEGNYKLWADVKPQGGTDQNLSSGFDVGNKMLTPAQLHPDQTFTKDFEGLKVTLRPSKESIKAGEPLMLNFDLVDAKTGGETHLLFH
jgi:hypothetical protein